MKHNLRSIFLATIFAHTLILNAAAQRLQSNQARFKYTRLPLEPLDNKIKVYYIDFTYGAEITNDEADFVSQRFKDFVCEPLKRDIPDNVRGKENILRIQVLLKPFQADSPVIHEESDLVGGGADRKSYYYTIEYDYPMQLQVFTGNDKEPIYKGFVNNKKHEYTSTKENTPTLRSTNTLGYSIYEEMKANAVQANMEKIQEAVGSRYANSVLSA